jgi:hypothetical protein
LKKLKEKTNKKPNYYNLGPVEAKLERWKTVWILPKYFWYLNQGGNILKNHFQLKIWPNVCSYRKKLPKIFGIEFSMP